MAKLTASQKRLIDNAVLITALKLIFTQLEKLGFPIYKLKQIANTTSGGTPSRRVPSYYGGDIPWIKSGELNDGFIKQAEEHITEQALNKSSAKIYSKGTVVIALYGATVGKTGILEIDAASNQAVCAVLPKTDEVSKNFLFWFLRNKRQDFLNDSFGGAQPNISQKVLKDTDIVIPDKKNQENICQFLKIVEQRQNGDKTIDLPDLPIPLNNIKDTVTKVEELAGKIEEARSLREQTIKETEALTKVSRRNIFGAKPSNDWIFLNNYVQDIENGKSPACEKRPADINEWGVLKVGVVSSGTYAPDENKALPVTIKPFPQYEVKSGDFLMSRANTTELVGSCAVVEKTRSKLLLSDKVFRFIFKKDALIIPNYLNHVLKSPALRVQIEKAATGTSSSMKNISKAKVFRLLVPVTPIEEQQRIVAYLDRLQSKIDEMKCLREQSLQELDALLPSILDKAFKGEL